MAPEAVVGIGAGPCGLVPGPLVEVGNTGSTHGPEVTEGGRPRAVARPTPAPTALGRSRPTPSSMLAVGPPTDADDWISLTSDQLPLDAALAWAVRPGCGAVVSFFGTVRDNAEGRDGVTSLEYEAYAEQAEARMLAVAAGARQHWPQLGRLVLLHRLGALGVGDTSVVVVASAPHRDEAFAAARYSIDTVKAAVPIWKREAWSGGSGWGTGATDIAEVDGEDRCGNHLGGDARFRIAAQDASDSGRPSSCRSGPDVPAPW